jgi:hypothetical protein
MVVEVCNQALLFHLAALASWPPPVLKSCRDGRIVLKSQSRGICGREVLRRGANEEPVVVKSPFAEDDADVELFGFFGQSLFHAVRVGAKQDSN